MTDGPRFSAPPAITMTTSAVLAAGSSTCGSPGLSSGAARAPTPGSRLIGSMTAEPAPSATAT